MTPRVKLIIGVITALAWLSQLIYLLPMPEERIGHFLQKQAKVFDSGSAQTAPSESRDAYLKRIRTVASEEFWSVWIVSALAIVLGLFAAITSIWQWRVSTFLLMLSSLVYLATWSLFNGVFTSELSISSLFVDMWKVARTLHTEAMFVHRDVVLVVVFGVLAIVSAASLVTDIVKARPAGK